MLVNPDGEPIEPGEFLGIQLGNFFIQLVAYVSITRWNMHINIILVRLAQYRQMLPRGFEPLTLSRHGSKPCAYASSATGAVALLSHYIPIFCKSLAANVLE